MAAKAGYGGSITFTGKTAGVQAWTLDDTGEVVDVTTLDDAQVRQFIGTMKTSTGTLTALWDSTDAIDVLDTGTARLRLGDGAYGYVMPIIITGKGTENRFDDVVRANITFQCNTTMPSLSSSSSSSSA
jgi:hypothetical protein